MFAPKNRKFKFFDHDFFEKSSKNGRKNDVITDMTLYINDVITDIYCIVFFTFRSILKFLINFVSDYLVEDILYLNFISDGKLSEFSKNNSLIILVISKKLAQFNSNSYFLPKIVIF